jgi:hypothetical protein
MADGVAITAGSGTTVATDDISNVHYQRVKNALGPDGTWTADLGGVDLGSGVGAAFVRARPNVATQAQNSSGLTTASTTYVTGDTVGAGWTFTSMCPANGGTGRITAAILQDKSDVIAGYELWFASGSITFGTDNSAPNASDSDLEKIIGRVTCSPVRDLGGSRISYTDYLSLPYVCDATSLYVYAVTLNDHNFFGTATDLRLRLFYELD